MAHVDRACGSEYWSKRQRILRHAKSHVTKDRYIKTFDPALVAAMKKLEAAVDLVNQIAPRVHQIQ